VSELEQARLRRLPLAANLAGSHGHGPAGGPTLLGTPAVGAPAAGTEAAGE
jgi:hypothetical protein